VYNYTIAKRKGMKHLAQPKPIKNKDGLVYAYLLRVYRGKGVKDYCKTVHIPEDITTPSKTKKWLAQEQAKFEMDCKAGMTPLEKKTFKEYAEYVMSVKERDRKHSTVTRYKELLQDRIYPELGFMKLTDITAEHLNRFYTNLSKPGQNKKTGGGLSEKTIVEHHRVIHAVYAMAYKEGLVPVNIADRATPPKVPKKEAQFFEEAEVAKISECLQSEPLKWKCITFLLIFSGARRGEIMGLKWSAVDFKNNEIEIKNNLLYSPGKGIYEDTPKTGRSRKITIDPAVMALLKQQKREQTLTRMKLAGEWHEQGFCFTQENGNPMHPDSITDWLDKFAKKHDLPHIYPHKFRHTHISILLSHGVSVVDVAKRAGHEQTSTTENIYAHVLAKADEKASDVFSQALNIKIG